MPTVFLTLVALIAPFDLRLSAELVGLRVQARLANDADEPVAVIVGDSCAGPLYKLIIDGKPRPFIGTGKACGTPHLYARTVPAHGEYAILSDALDGRHHAVQVQLRELASQVLQVPTVLRVELTLAATAQVARGHAVDVEIVHVNRSPEEVSLPTCGEDRLLIDGKELPLPSSAPCDGTSRTVPIRGAFVTRGRVSLEPGRHVLRARWRDTQSEDAIVDVAE